MKPLSLAALVVSVFATGFLAGRFSVDASPAPAAPAPMAAMPSAPAMGMPTGAAPQEAGGLVQGTVAEVIQVPNYTYLRLTGPQGETWAAVATDTTLAVGQAVSIGAATMMSGFTSKTLNRTFDTIWFGSLSSAGAAAAPAMGGGQALPPGHPPMNAGANPAAGALEAVKRAEGALSLRVADVYTERQLLAGRAVRVKGTVTRVTTINGKTYAHLSDGSGAKETKDDDLTVILSAEVKQNDQVTAEGTVALDRDLGIGTIYPVVLDAASVVAK
jgi:hypothetical protein